MRCRVLALPLLAAAAQAATVDLELPVCQPADPAPAVDGRLEDWRGIAALAVQPEGHPALGAEVRTAYDAQGLLLAAAWRSPRPPGAGDALGLRLTWAGRVVHLVARPEGEDAVLEVRRGGEEGARTIPGAAALAAAAGGAVVRQRVPVQGGRHYHLRFRLRSEGTSGREVQRPAPDRGYTALHIGIDFIGPNGRFVGAQSVYDDREWNQVLDGGTHMLPRPALTPPGTTHAEVIIRAAINAGGLTPAFMVDEVELVESR